MPTTKHDTILSIDGYEILVTFADSQNTMAIGHAKQILLSSFVSASPKSLPDGILADLPQKKYSISRGKPHAP